jgi:tetraacyldisaccharide 4'-kinase
MKEKLQSLSNFVWYKDNFIGLCLLPLSMVFHDMARLRRYLYRIGLLKSHKLPVPVIIVGNITVGGTGKTPLTIFLATLLKQSGYKPGIICRGYGGQAEHWPQQVTADSDPRQIGDEPVLIARRTGCPVLVGPERVAATKQMLDKSDCNVIISDDGLQHYSLQRDIEIIVIDGERRFGNRYCLPSGPLREALSRIHEVDFLVCNGVNAEENEYSMIVEGTEAVNLLTGNKKPLNHFKNKACHAVVGMGNPQRFFALLDNAEISYEAHVFPDHHHYLEAELQFGAEREVLMTEKDAVKCSGFAKNNHWFIPVQAKLPETFTEKLLEKLKEKIDG